MWKVKTADQAIINKSKSLPRSDLKKREVFLSKVESLFDISSRVAVDQIQGDRLRDEESKEEDLMFLADQRDPSRRKMFVDMEGRDTEYDKKVGDKLARSQRPKRMTGKVSDDTNNNNLEDNEVVEDDNDEDYVPEETTKKKSETVTLTVSRKRLAKDTAITAKRHRIGIVAQRDLLANIINVGGGDVSEFSLSNKTVRLAGAASVKESAAQIKIDFKKMVVKKFTLFMLMENPWLSSMTRPSQLKRDCLSLYPLLTCPLTRSWVSPSPPPTVARTRGMW